MSLANYDVVVKKGLILLYNVFLLSYYKDYAGTKVVLTGAASKAKTITVKK